MNKKNILVTGSAGFIGFHLCKSLINDGHNVVGLDNINNYYNQQLKFDRLKLLGIKKEDAEVFGKVSKSENFLNFEFIRLNIEDRKNLPAFFEHYKFEKVINLAAQAGVRYSIENPEAYVDSNLVGFANLLECCRNHNVKHLIYASSSSVYGQNKKVPFTTEDNVDHPISLYAATKKSNELMAYTYSHLYKFKTTGLRFFTVYGPWGRPDMAMFLFTNAILNDKSIKVYNNGNLERDFTYIDDIIGGVIKIIHQNESIDGNYNIYNIGNSKPVNLMDFIREIEVQLGIIAKKEMLPMQPGDVKRTWADVDSLRRNFNYSPTSNISKGVAEFIKWFKEYYN